MPGRLRALTLPAIFLSALLTPVRAADALDDLFKDMRAVKAQGASSTAARAAWDKLVRQGPDVLPRILAAMNTPDTVTANRLRTAAGVPARRQASLLYRG